MALERHAARAHVRSEDLSARSPRDGERGIVLDGRLRFESEGTAFDVTGDGAEVRVEAHGLRGVRWTPRLVISSLMLYLRLARRLRGAGLRLKLVRSGKKRT